MLMRVVKKIEELTDDPEMVQYIDVEKGMELGRQQDIKEAAEKAAKEAAKKAAKEATEKATKETERKTKIETAKKMLEDKLDIKTISKYTGLSEDEIKKL